jgi:ribosomal protein S18 acetylase RimI-like enzyme
MPAVVRRATREDAAAIAKLAVALFELHVEWDERRFTQIGTIEGATRYYGERAGAENAAVFVAEDGERIVGFAYIEYEPVLYAQLATTAAWLHDIYVEPDARRSHTASNLLAAVEAEAKRLGADKVLLSVALRNMAGQNLFEQYGFRTTMHEMMLEIDKNNG